MAWTAIENFDSYTPGTNINGLNGGSGWAAAWSQTQGEAADATVETAPAGGQGGVALRLRNTTSITEDVVIRTITSISAGTVRVLARVNGTNPSSLGGYGFNLRDSTDGRMYVFFGNGNILIFNNSIPAYETIQAFSVDTWYTIDIDFDDAAQPNQYRARVNNGTWTGWKTVNGGTYTAVDRISISNEVSAAPDAEIWIDGIEPMTEGPPAQTLMGAILM